MILLVSDTHFSDKPLARSRYKIFAALREFIEREKPTMLVHCGDIADNKNYHSAHLVNSVVCGFAELAGAMQAHGGEIHVLSGNHDFVPGEKQAFWNFLNYVGVHYHHTAAIVDTSAGRCAFYPYGTLRDTPRAHSGSAAKFAFAHECFVGAKNNIGGDIPTGEQLDDFYNAIGVDNNTILFAGDIHSPQCVGKIQYVGAPYQTEFGCNYTGRCLVVDGDVKSVDVFGDSHRQPILHTLAFHCDKNGEIVRSPSEAVIRAGDYVKAQLFQSDNEVHTLQALKMFADTEVASAGAFMHSINSVITQSAPTLADIKKSAAEEAPLQTYNSFCKEKQIDGTMKDFGKSVLKSVM